MKLISVESLKSLIRRFLERKANLGSDFSDYSLNLKIPFLFKGMVNSSYIYIDNEDISNGYSYLYRKSDIIDGIVSVSNLYCHNVLKDCKFEIESCSSGETRFLNLYKLFYGDLQRELPPIYLIVKKADINTYINDVNILIELSGNERDIKMLNWVLRDLKEYS